jgi:hypothetical protein
MNNICSICPKLAIKLCSKCRKVTYCSLECQQIDWHDIHKFVCTNKTLEPLSDKFITALVFKTGGSIELTNVKYKIETYEDSPPEVVPDLKFLIKGYVGSNLVSKHPYTNERLQNSFFLFYNDNFLNENHDQNLAIQKITQQRHGHDWRGTVLVIKVDRSITSKGDEHEFTNIGLPDVNIVKHYLTWYGGIMCKAEAEANRKRLEKLFPESVVYL